MGTGSMGTLTWAAMATIALPIMASKMVRVQFRDDVGQRRPASVRFEVPIRAIPSNLVVRGNSFSWVGQQVQP